MSVMIAIFTCPVAFAQQEDTNLKKPTQFEFYVGGKSQRFQGGAGFFRMINSSEFIELKVGFPYQKFEVGTIERKFLTRDGIQEIGLSGSLATTQFDQSVGLNFLFAREFETPGKSLRVTLSPLRLFHILDNIRLGEDYPVEMQLGSELRMEAKAPLSDSIRGVFTGSVSKTFVNRGIDFFGQASLECDLSRAISVNLGVCTETALRESNTSVSGSKIVQASTGLLFRAGVSVRLAD